jgi:DNA transposition AAA+ family ATPase
MTSMTQIRRLIKTRRRGGLSDNQIARELGVSAPEIGRLLKGKYPGGKIFVLYVIGACQSRKATGQRHPSMSIKNGGADCHRRNVIEL